MLGLVIIVALAWGIGSAVHNAIEGVRKDYRKRVKKAKKAKHRKAEVRKRAGKKAKPTGKSPDWGVKAGSFAGTTLVGGWILTRDFGRGFAKGWPKGKARAEEWNEGRKVKKSGSTPLKPAPTTAPPSAPPPAPGKEPPTAPAAPSTAASEPNTPHLRVVPAPKPDSTPAETTTDTLTTTAGGTPMAITKIGEVLNVSSLKRALAQVAAESTTNEEEATEIESRAAQMLGAIETILEQATVLEFDKETLAEIAALRDAITAQLTGARNYLASAADGASVALDAANNVHKRHGGIAEAVAAAPAAMAKREAYTPE
ncbi:hypothetical protein ABZ845_06910 [Streptomyces sp. NPDC047022]|uniref:hypothetical protein n=1 Tax=Streptomyces sp. NPDC047022 TaxID=3155737 RepID=UPI0033CE1019